MLAQLPGPPAAPPANQLPPIKTSITVTGTIAAEAPASITVLTNRELQQTPGVNLDDRLRAVPGFSLFRRSSSLVANPTTQGVSLRGIGSTGASRTLVLWDGVPLNDPFGGWVYWDRLPVDELERVEISRGASTSVFGDLAMGGVISTFTRPAAEPRIWAGYEGGSDDTQEISAGASDLWNQRVAGMAEVRAFSTDGYFIVPSNLRGAVDQPASLQFVAGVAKMDFIGRQQRLAVKLDILAESRGNGTVLQNNSTSLGTLSANYSHDSEHDGISVLGYH
ncbi:MAG: Plug domain-containing protein, partial [Bryobacteraceae bacterium]